MPPPQWLLQDGLIATRRVPRLMIVTIKDIMNNLNKRNTHLLTRMVIDTIMMTTTDVNIAMSVLLHLSTIERQVKLMYPPPTTTTRASNKIPRPLVCWPPMLRMQAHKP
jgi:hypothetical protein